MDSLLMLSYSARGKFPTLADDLRVSHIPGWLSVLSAVAGVSPELRTLGILNQRQHETGQQSVRLRLI